LGLAQVYGIAKQHDGHVVLQTREDGATFTLYLPALQVTQPETPAALDVTPLVRGRGELILIVEDETILRAALTETLQLLNYRVLAAANGREALAALAARPEIELVLSDLVMPEMGGAALFQEMRERGLTTPMVALTGHSRKNELQQLQAQGLAGWLAKPVQQKRLAQALAQALGRM
jgi:CheY-like chemotaxis protein